MMMWIRCDLIVTMGLRLFSERRRWAEMGVKGGEGQKASITSFKGGKKNDDDSVCLMFLV